jgi:hypothetical protein
VRKIRRSIPLHECLFSAACIDSSPRISKHFYLFVCY